MTVETWAIQYTFASQPPVSNGQIAMIVPWDSQVVWIVVVGFILAFFLAFGVGANDVANSFGTSVGSKVLTLRQACILATIFEILGAVLIGYQVSDTVRKGIFEVNMYVGYEKDLMLGYLAALGGSAIWNIMATFFRMPISGTHSIVGAVVGFALVAKGADGIKWLNLGKIVASWFISPILSGVVSVSLFLLIQHLILKKKDPLEPGLKALPFFYGFTILVNVFSVVHEGPEVLKFNLVPWWGALITAVGMATITVLVVQFVVVPYQRRQIYELVKSQSDKIEANPQKELDAESPEFPKVESSADMNGTLNGKPHQAQQNGDADPKERYSTKVSTINRDSSGGPLSSVSQQPLVESVTVVSMVPAADPNKDLKKEVDDTTSDRPETAKLFSFLQILTAIFGSFAHGGNDVSNAIGPLVALWLIFKEGNATQSGVTDVWLLLYGGAGISLGLWIWGRRVIKTMGEDLTKITPSTGFTIEIGAASTVLLASKIGLPISTTHCKVGSVVFVGWVRSRQSVDWSLFRNIVMAWVLTLPITGGLTAALMAILMATAGRS